MCHFKMGKLKIEQHETFIPEKIGTITAISSHSMSA
jgi:hypothetical protein